MRSTDVGNHVATKRRIVAAASQNIDSLNIDAVIHSLFNKILRVEFAEILRYLRIRKGNPRELLRTFSEFRVTWNPEVSWTYDTHGNAFVINLLALFCAPEWRLAAAFVHEAKHASFCKEMGVLDKSDTEQDIFDKEHRQAMEIEAIDAECNFFLSVKRYVTQEIATYVTAEESPIGVIDEHISQAYAILEALRDKNNNNVKDYTGSTKDHARKNNFERASKLGIPYPKPDADGKYREILVDLERVLDSISSNE